MDVVSLYTTWPDMESAQAAGEALVAQKLAACVNILPGVHSIYRWEGALQHETEVAMFVKTTTARAEVARDALLGLHPYDAPCVLALKTDAAASNPMFLEWVTQDTSL